MTTAVVTSSTPKVDFYVSEEKAFLRWCDKLDLNAIEVANHYWSLGFSLQEVKDQISIYYCTLDNLTEQNEY